MPLLDFKCNKCGGEVIDVLVKDTKSPNKIVVCPTCSIEMVQKIATVGSFVLEGRTWARDGYSSK